MVRKINILKFSLLISVFGVTTSASFVNHASLDEENCIEEVLIEDRLSFFCSETVGESSATCFICDCEDLREQLKK